MDTFLRGRYFFKNLYFFLKMWSENGLSVKLIFVTTMFPEVLFKPIPEQKHYSFSISIVVAWRGMMLHTIRYDFNFLFTFLLYLIKEVND
jgi:hypothetical protein